MHLIYSQIRQLSGVPVFPVASIGLSLFFSLSLIQSSKVIALESSQELVAQTTHLGRRILFVDPRQGNDTSANGSQNAPFKTITQALKIAQPNAVIQLAVGTYTTQTGEIFPIRLKPNTTIQGSPGSRGQGIVIQGGGRFTSPTSAVQNIAVLGANQARLSGVTVSNLNRRGYGLWLESTNTVVISNTFTANKHDGISIVGSGMSTIRSNHFSGNGANGMTIYGTTQPEIRDNVIERSGFGININQQSAPVLTGNRIVHNLDGIVVQASAQPILRLNTIENNRRDGLVAIAQSRPDLGRANQPGGNVFRNNGRYDIHNAVKNQIISAFGNQISGHRLAGQIDYTGTTARSIASQSVFSSSPASTSQPGSAIEIPVEVVSGSARTTQSPTRTAPSQVTQPAILAQTRSIQNQSLLQETTVVEIPVPPPISAASTAPTPLTPPPPPGSNLLNSSGLSANLLPVPNTPIPLGHAGSSSTVFATRGTLFSAPGNPPPPPVATAALGPRFRVVVEVRDSDQRAQIRSLVPDAFRSSYQGKAVMQVGSFKQRAEADVVIHLMTSNGLNPIVELVQ